MATVLDPAIQAGLDLNSPSKVFNLGLSAVQKGDISANQFAIDYATMYRAAQRLNVTSKQLFGLGISPTEQYNTKLDTGTFISHTVDNANAGAVLNATSRALAAGVMNKDKFKSDLIPQLISGITSGAKEKLGAVPGNSGFPSYEPTQGR